ncbi:MAG: hypothetical protein ACLF0G_04120 [Candidatus Brocadiia bacterium]
MTRTGSWTVVLAAAALAGPWAQGAEALDNPFAGGRWLKDWHRTSNKAHSHNEMLRVDALRPDERVAVFRRDLAFESVTIEVEFMVESAGTGERAFGVLFGSTDSATYHAVHFGRREVALCRVQPEAKREVIARRGVAGRHEGVWHRAVIDVEGTNVRVVFRGQHLFTARAEELRPGYIGLYAIEGRVQVRGLEYKGRRTRLPEAWEMR